MKKMTIKQSYSGAELACVGTEEGTIVLIDFADPNGNNSANPFG